MKNPAGTPTYGATGTYRKEFMRYIRSSSLSLENITKIYDKAEESSSVATVYPFRVSPSYADLIRQEGDAIWRQCIPDPRELDDAGQHPDPLSEQLLSPVPGLIHRYPDRVVLLVSNRCPVYCRFCMRKRHVGEGDTPMDDRLLKQVVEYIAAHSAIRDVILSGGDPLMLDDDSLHHVLRQLRAISHVSIIRIGTRVPVTLPERVTPELCALLKRFHPLYINTHFNHPAEITPLSTRACELLADAGIPLGNQTVLLAGVNDSVETMRSLQTGLLSLRVRPYYIHQMDLVRGTAHFRTPVTTGLDIIRGLRGHMSGLAVPQYVIDLPDGKGKVPILPDDVQRQGDLLILRTYRGERVIYRDMTPVADA
jgi:lysine 2,3-aminomutase